MINCTCVYTMYVFGLLYGHFVAYVGLANFEHFDTQMVAKNS